MMKINLGRLVTITLCGISISIIQNAQCMEHPGTKHSEGHSLTAQHKLTNAEIIDIMLPSIEIGLHFYNVEKVHCIGEFKEYNYSKLIQDLMIYKDILEERASKFKEQHHEDSTGNILLAHVTSILSNHDRIFKGMDPLQDRKQYGAELQHRIDEWIKTRPIETIINAIKEDLRSAADVLSTTHAVKTYGVSPGRYDVSESMKDFVYAQQQYKKYPDDYSHEKLETSRDKLYLEIYKDLYSMDRPGKRWEGTLESMMMTEEKGTEFSKRIEKRLGG
jgi:hypothetical protein